MYSFFCASELANLLDKSPSTSYFMPYLKNAEDYCPAVLNARVTSALRKIVTSVTSDVSENVTRRD